MTDRIKKKKKKSYKAEKLEPARVSTDTLKLIIHQNKKKKEPTMACQ